MHHEQERVDAGRDRATGYAETGSPAGKTGSACAACPAGRLLLLPRMMEAAFSAVLPVPVARHLRNARRETLLAARCLLDQMLAREQESEAKTRRKIEIE